MLEERVQITEAHDTVRARKMGGGGDPQTRFGHATDHARPIPRLGNVRELFCIADTAGLAEFYVEIRCRILLDDGESVGLRTRIHPP